MSGQNRVIQAVEEHLVFVLLVISCKDSTWPVGPWSALSEDFVSSVESGSEFPPLWILVAGPALTVDLRWRISLRYYILCVLGSVT